MTEYEDHRGRIERLEHKVERLEREDAVVRRFVLRLARRVRRLEQEVHGLEPGPATHATLTIGDNMAGLSIDATDGTATLDYEDDHNDPNAPTPADAALAVSSSDDTIVTVAQDATNPLQFDITPVAVGDFTITVTGLGTGANGPIPDVTASSSILVGEAATGTLVIAG